MQRRCGRFAPRIVAKPCRVDDGVTIAGPTEPLVSLRAFGRQSHEMNSTLDGLRTRAESTPLVLPAYHCRNRWR